MVYRRGQGQNLDSQNISTETNIFGQNYDFGRNDVIWAKKDISAEYFGFGQNLVFLIIIISVFLSVSVAY